MLLKSYLNLSPTTIIVNKSGTTKLNTVIEEVKYMKSFDRAIGDSSQGRITKKSMARKLAEPDIGYHHLKTLFTTKGERGFLPCLPICQQA
ncbi:unnamed protein product, partial [Pocillopora meandrina]